VNRIKAVLEEMGILQTWIIERLSEN